MSFFRFSIMACLTEVINAYLLQKMGALTAVTTHICM